jgi:hypothetical protein
VDHRDPVVKGGEGSDEGCRRIALDQDDVGLLGFHEWRQSLEGLERYAGERLAGLDDVEVMVRGDREEL